jgi:hypothetical protein
MPTGDFWQGMKRFFAFLSFDRCFMVKPYQKSPPFHRCRWTVLRSMMCPTCQVAKAVTQVFDFRLTYVE